MLCKAKTKDGRIVTGYYVHLNGAAYIAEPTNSVTRNTKVSIDLTPVDASTVRYQTSYTDRDKKPIYTGDILVAGKFRSKRDNNGELIYHEEYAGTVIVDSLEGDLTYIDELTNCFIDGCNEKINELMSEYFVIDLGNKILDEHAIETAHQFWHDHFRAATTKQNYAPNILMNGESCGVREAVTEKDYGLAILMNDKDGYVRMTVAEQGYGLDILVNDENGYVREAVAKKGYGLDILVNDRDCGVRKAVAEHGYGLDILVNDEDRSVRKTVAKKGYGLGILVNDRNCSVRKAVAEQGYGLDILVNDKDWHVRKTVAEVWSNRQCSEP